MNSSLLRVLCASTLLASLPVFSQPADETANRRHFFPLFADGDGFRSHLFLTNASDAANQCTLYLQGPGLDGFIFEPGRDVTPAGASVIVDLPRADSSRTLASVGFQPLTFGYASLECAEPVIAGMLLTQSGFGSAQAMTALQSSQFATEFQFPVFPRTGSLGLIFANDTGREVSCMIELEDGGEVLAGSASIAVPGRSTAVRFLDEVIQFPDGFGGGKAIATCDRDIAALGMSLKDSVFTALPALVLDGGSTAKASHVLPLVVDGEGFQSQLLITNLAETANRCTIGFHGEGLNTGRFETTAGLSAATLELAAGGDQVSLLSRGAAPLAFGYATVECDAGVSARNLLTAGDRENTAGMAAIHGTQAADVFRFPHMPRAGLMALIFANDMDADASCAAIIGEFGGVREISAPISAPAKSTTIRFLRDLFGFVDFLRGGEATVSCTGDVNALAVPLNGAVFSALPPAVLSFSQASSDSPIFPYGSNLEDQIFAIGKFAVGPFLPNAIGGNGKLTYSLEPSVPGMNFNANSNFFAGIPTTAGEYAMTYTVTDEDGDSDSLSFNVRVEPDSAPSFAGVAFPEDLRFTLGEPIEPAQLPEAEGGNAPVRHILTQSGSDLPGFDFFVEHPPGLDFNGNTRRLSGTPTETGVYNMVYTVIDLDGDMDTLEFTITITVPVTSESLIDAAGCDNGRFIDDQISNSALAADCRALAGFANVLIETGLIAEDNVIRQWGKGRQTKLDTWDGLFVFDGRVTDIWLGGRELKGGLPPQLGQLGALESLVLGGNEFSGPIPSELANLSNLGSLWLPSNRLSGEIPPELGRLQRLELLALGENELTGTIPPALGQLGNLEYLDLRDNELRGAIPAELANLSSLRDLNLGINGLSGPIPPELGQLTGLTSLNLDFNELTGSLPPELGQLTKLEDSSLRYNRLSGPIPPEFASLGNLRRLALDNNKLTGPIPDGLGGLTGLEILDLDFNRLTGALPWAFRERIGRDELVLRIKGNLISGFEAPSAPGASPDFPSDPAANGNAAHSSIAWYQGPLVLEWDWKGKRVEHQTPILGRWALLAVNIDHDIAKPPLVITRVLNSRDEVLVERLAQAAPPATEETASGRWRTEYVFDLPGEYFQAGNQLVHVIDPDGELAESNEEDNVAEPVVLYGEAPPKFRATFIPVQLPEEDAWYADLDPELLMRGTLAMLPIADDFEVRIGPALESDSGSVEEVLVQLLELWNVEADPDEFYHGIANGDVGGIGLLASQVAVSSLSIHYVTPHEFGHNFNLLHTPGCYAGGPDRNYPYPAGRLGPIRGWGPNWRLFVTGENENYADVMSYCGEFHHISDYHYRLATEYWLSFNPGNGAGSATLPPAGAGGGVSRSSTSADGSSVVAVQADSSSDGAGSLALSGRVGAGGAWSLIQARLSDRAPRPAAEDGEFTLILFDSAGVRVYAEPLSVMSVSDGDESFWAARTPLPLRAAREIVILDARGNEVLRQVLPDLE